MAMHAYSIRQVLAYTTVAAFLVFFFTSAINHHANFSWHSLSPNASLDFSHYRALTTLSAHEFPLDERNRRVIIVGDIHGMDTSLQSLLVKLSYNPTSDVLIHVGDIVTKGTHDGSMAVLSYMASNNITGVRGNHDQEVIQWRAWLNWVGRFPEGRQWLDKMLDKWAEAEEEGIDPRLWADREMRQSKSEWWKTIPKGWKLFDDHHKIAHSMSPFEYDYLVSLPLTLHVPSAHVYLAHAGILPSDPRYNPHHSRQPLARVPTPSPSGGGDQKPNTTTLRRLQELAVLKEVPQNQDPWVILNMRSVKQDHQVTKRKSGKPWSKIWKRDMSLCDGFDKNTHLSTFHKYNSDSLPCHPSTVVYGHAAARGLDIKRWSVGLDSGCVYGRRLTALVLGDQSLYKRNDDDHEDDEDEDDDDDDSDDDDDDDDKPKKSHSTIPFGDDGIGQIISIRCQ